MTLGEKIAKQRKDLHYTQEQFADLLGVSRQAVSKWEADTAYPETDKLVRMGKLFGCSMDYLLYDDCVDKTGTPAVEASEHAGIQDRLQRCFCEHKSEKTVFGLPLYHIGRHAKGFFAIGLSANGVFAIGLRAAGVFSLGLLSFGLVSVGMLSLGLVGLGILALGLLSAGSIAAGLVTFGAVSLGVVALGALSVGEFAFGALAIGKYLAMGDHAYAMIAAGDTQAMGELYHTVGQLTSGEKAEMAALLDSCVPTYLGWAKGIARLFLL